jgi:endonuclease-3 related protein
MEVFDRLLAAQGPRHWWPAESAFEVIVGAILTQNTAWRNVPPALERMKAADLWGFARILAAETTVLTEAIRPAGYFNAKARKLKEFAALVCDHHAVDLDSLFRVDTQQLRETLLGVWGIGEETADDIVLYAANKPSFVIDRYTMRVVDRLGWKVEGNKYGDYQRLFTDRLPVDVPLYNEYHALLDGHAARVCTVKRPRCESCCLLDLCQTGQNMSTAENQQ